jgi:hypothetical protein
MGRGAFKIISIISIFFSIGFSNSLENMILPGWSWCKVGDADNDGQNEVVLGYGFREKSAHLIIFKYTDNYYKPVWGVDFPWNEAAEVSVDIGDVNGDGQNEVVVMNATPSDINPNGKIRIYKHIGGNNYQLLWSDNLSEGFRRIACGNIDNDAAEEIVIGNSYYDRTLYYYDYQGGNNWTKITIEYVGEDCSGLQVADADNDGKNEIVAGFGIWPPYTVRIYKYIGGSVQRIWSYSFCNVSPYGPAYYIYVGDTDNDSKNELLVTEESPYQEGNPNDVFIFEHAGGTSWNLVWQIGFPYPASHGPIAPYIGRIQNTGQNEFCFVNMDTLCVYRWTGSTYTRVASQYIPNKVSEHPFYRLRHITGGDADNDGEHETLILLGANIYIVDKFPFTGISENESSKITPIGSSIFGSINPFRKEVRILYFLPESGETEIQILNAMGSIVRMFHLQAKKGYNELIWDGKDGTGRILPPGNYFYHIIQKGKLIGKIKEIKIE